MKYKCISIQPFQIWLTVGKVYDGESVVSPTEYSGGAWIEIKRADDGFPCYARSNQFVVENAGGGILEV